MQIGVLIDHIEKIALPAYAANWDISGIQVASKRTDITSLAICLDPTTLSISKALAKGAQFILSHHPLTLKPDLPRKLDSYFDILQMLLSVDVPLYAAHTSLDVNPNGPMNWLAKELKLKSCKTIEPLVTDNKKNVVPGYGLLGTLPKKVKNLDEFIKILGKVINLDMMRICGPMPQKSISKIAYCTGAGVSFASKAYELGADIFITGDVKYHDALNSNITILDVGHHILEEEMMRQMYILLKKDFPKVRVFFIPSSSPFYRSLPN